MERYKEFFASVLQSPAETFAVKVDRMIVVDSEFRDFDRLDKVQKSKNEPTNVTYE